MKKKTFYTIAASAFLGIGTLAFSQPISADEVTANTQEANTLPQGQSTITLPNDNSTNWVDNNGLTVSTQDAQQTASDSTDPSASPNMTIPVGTVYNWKLVESYSFDAETEKDAEMQIAGELYHHNEDDFGEWFMNAGLSGRNYYKVYRYTDSDAYNVYVKVVTKVYSDPGHNNKLGTFTDYFTN